MKRIGLTGNIGSGKSLVCSIFEKLGVPVYYADDRAKIFLDSPEVQAALQERYGVDIVKGSKVDRKKLASIVFKRKEELQYLNSRIHPLLKNDMDLWFEEQGDIPYAIQEAAILFENGFENLFDKIVMISSPERLRIERVMKRDGVGEEAVLERIRNQWSEERKIALSDYVIINDEIQMLLPQTLKLHQSLYSITVAENE